MAAATQPWDVQEETPGSGQDHYGRAAKSVRTRVWRPQFLPWVCYASAV